MPDQRAFQRFDIITVLEFSLMTAAAGIFTGITRNFSYEGFCFETQCLSFAKGDSLEVRLRHPHSDLKVSVPAYVVWKKPAEKFAHLVGIKLKETELETRIRMLEIMSAAGELPVDSFLSAGDDERIDHTKPVTQPLDINQSGASEADAEAAEEFHEDTEPGAVNDEILLSKEQALNTVDRSEDTFSEVYRAAQAEEPEAEDMPYEEAIESDMPWPRVQKETSRSPYYIPRALKLLLGNRTFIYSSIAAVVIMVSVYGAYLLLKGPGPSIKPPAPVPAQSTAQTTLQEAEEVKNVVPAVPGGAEFKAAVPALQEPDEPPVSKTADSKPGERKAPAVLPKTPDVRTPDDQTRYIQIGAWRDPANARDMLQKVKKYYPDAYLTSGSKLNRVKIPAKDQAQVNSITKDIEDKFQIKPLVSSVR